MEKLINDAKLVQQDIDRIEQQLAEAPKTQKATGVQPSFGDSANEEIFKLELQNKDLLFQVEALNAINATLLSRVKISGGKNLTQKE